MNGAYVLVAYLRKNSKIRIGKLGAIDFLKGYYCYVGSALGKSINLENRIKRHERLVKDKTGKVRWHIDYFLINPKVLLKGIIIFSGKVECKISQILEKNAKKTILGFGSSDCKYGCKGHFHHFKNMKEFLHVVKKI